MSALLNLLIGYLAGSIQPGLIVGRLYGRIDIREYGSGKTGFTNTLRALGPGAAGVVVAGDIAKGVLPVLLGRFLFDDAWATALGAAGAVIGHTWPVFAGFRGGRGVATSFGAFLAMAPLAALATLLFGLVVLAATRYVSLMSVTGVFLGFVVFTALIAVDQLPQAYLAFGVLATLAVEVNHLGNIRRLIAGTEPKLGQGGAPRSPRSV